MKNKEKEMLGLVQRKEPDHSGEGRSIENCFEDKCHTMRETLQEEKLEDEFEDGGKDNLEVESDGKMKDRQLSAEEWAAREKERKMAVIIARIR